MEQGSGVSTENFTLDPSYQMDGSNYMLRTKRVDTTPSLGQPAVPADSP